MYAQADTPRPQIPFMEIAIAFRILMYVFETVLDARQHAKFAETELNPKLVQTLKDIDSSTKGKKEKGGGTLLESTKQKFSETQVYGRDKSMFGLVRSFVDEGLSAWLTLVIGWLPLAWDLAGDALERLGGVRGEGGNVICHSLLWFAGTHLVSTLLAAPFTLYFTFVVEERHGMNKMTLRLWFVDELKSLALGAAIGLPVLGLLLSVISWAGENFFVYVWGTMFVFSLLMMSIFPNVIQPCFNRFVSLEESAPEGDDAERQRRVALQRKIEKLAAHPSIQYPLRKIFVVDGSKRSSHSNAYCFGFGSNKRIVLFDTLLEQATDDEIVAILAHELGHWVRWHTIQGFVISQLYIGAMFYAFGLCYTNADLFASYGFRERPVFVGLCLFTGSVWAPVDRLMNFILTVNSRKREFEADEFGAKMGHGDALQSGLIKIGLENLSNLSPDPWYSAYHYTHPPLVERLDWIGRCSASARQQAKKEQ